MRAIKFSYRGCLTTHKPAGPLLPPGSCGMAGLCGIKFQFGNCRVSVSDWDYQRGILRCTCWLIPEFGRGYYAPLRQYEGGGGRKPPPQKKNANMDLCVFFTSQPTATAVGCPSPFEPLRDGFATGATAGSGESKPLLFSYEWGKPGGEGEGQYRSPSYCRLSTLILKVARLGVGIFRFAPRCAALAVLGGCLRGVGCRSLTT
jgi:hypothetical protein